MNPNEPCLPNIPDPQQEPERFYYCPCCGRAVYETVYTDKQSGLIIGCDQCIEEKFADDILEAEA